MLLVEKRKKCWTVVTVGDFQDQEVPTLIFQIAAQENNEKRKSKAEENVRVGLVSLAVDCRAAVDLVPMDDKDGKGSAKGRRWAGTRLEQGLREHKPTPGVCPWTPGFTPLHLAQHDSLSILH